MLISESEFKKLQKLNTEWEKIKDTPVQKLNNETGEWEDVHFPQEPVQQEFVFIDRLAPNTRPAHISEDGRYEIDKENSFFKVGDMIEDNGSGHNMGVGFIIEKELFDGPTPYTYTDKTDGKKKTGERPICGWKYLVEFPDPDKKGLARRGELWVWEFPLRELVDEGLLILHSVKKNEA